MKINAISGQTVTTKQGPVHYVNTRDRQNQQYNQNNQRGRGGFRGSRIHVDHKTQEVNSINNNETQIQDNVVSVGINMVQTIYNHVRQKTKLLEMRKMRTRRKSLPFYKPKLLSKHKWWTTRGNRNREHGNGHWPCRNCSVLHKQWLGELPNRRIFRNGDIGVILNKKQKNTIERQSKWTYC